jgi:hypothetical protein
MGILETGVILKIFGVGVAGAIGTIVLNQAGKQHIALMMDLGLVVIVFGYVIYKAWNAIQHIMWLFGV